MAKPSEDKPIGPWKRADLATLVKICKDASLPFGPQTGGLLSPPPSPYADISSARKALVAHTIYRWLKRNLNEVLSLAPKNPSIDEFRFVHLVVQSLAIAFFEAQQPREARARRDKDRVSAWNAVTRVERYIDEGTFLLESSKRNQLAELLAEAKSELMSRRRKGRKHPSLEFLAYELHRRFAIADARIITAVAAATGLNCSERTAQRYVAIATGH